MTQRFLACGLLACGLTAKQRSRTTSREPALAPRSSRNGEAPPPRHRGFREPGFCRFSAELFWMFCGELRRFAETVIFLCKMALKFCEDLRRLRIRTKTSKSLLVKFPTMAQGSRSRAREQLADRRSRAPLKASRRGQDKRGRRRSAALPPNEPSWENVGNMRQNVAPCPHLKQSIAKCMESVALL